MNLERQGGEFMVSIGTDRGLAVGRLEFGQAGENNAAQLFG